MKFQDLMYTVILTLCSASLHLAIAQESQDLPGKHGYRVVDTGTLGGPNSFLGFEGSRNINNNGTLAAGTDTSSAATPPFCLNDCFVGHATTWRDGVLSDLGTIANGNGGTSWISDTGLIAGLSMNGVIDPVTGQAELEAVLWKDGGPINLGTSGGTQSIAGGVNDQGQVVGCATNIIAMPLPFAWAFRRQRRAAPSCGKTEQCTIWARSAERMRTPSSSESQAESHGNRGRLPLKRHEAANIAKIVMTKSGTEAA